MSKELIKKVNSLIVRREESLDIWGVSKNNRPELDIMKDCKATIEALQEEKASMQAKIDSLMFEFCPDEMTEQQVAEFEKHQVVAEGKFDLTEHAEGDSSDE